MPDPPLPFDAIQARLLPIADLVMVVMISRPASGSLRDTRVTTATIWLAAAVAIVAGALAALAVVLGLVDHAPAWLVGGGLLLLLFLGCADLAVFGIRQRRLARAA